MKKIICISILAAVFLLAACSDELVVVFKPKAISLTAMTELPKTKTTVVSETHVYWEPGDALSVFTGDTTGKFVADLAEPSATAVFWGTLADSDGYDMLWALYPYSEDASFDGECFTTVLPDTQTARPGSFGKDMNLAVARTADSNLQFYNVGGGVCFSITEEGVRRILFEGIDGEVLAGKVKIGFDDNGIPAVMQVLEGSKSITLLPPDGETFTPGTRYYIVALPGALDKGYKMRFYKSGDYAKRISEKSVAIIRSTYGVITNADEGLEYEPTTAPYPKTAQEWQESDDITLNISSSVTGIIADYDLENSQSSSRIAQDVARLDGVNSVTTNEDGSHLIIQQSNGVYVNVFLKSGDESEDEGDEGSQDAGESYDANQSRASSEVPEAKLSPASAATNTIMPSKRDVLLISPYQNAFSGVEEVIDKDYLSSKLKSIGYNLLYIPPKDLKLEHFTGDYLSRFALVMIVSHGADRCKVMDGTTVSTVVDTGIEVGTLDEGIDRSILSMAIRDGKPNYYITVPWLQETTSDSKAFSETMVYFGSCRSYRDDDFARFFESQGAGFLGHQKIMAVQFDNLVLHSFVSSLTLGMGFSKAVENISRDPWAKAEQNRLSGGTLWFFDLFAPTFPWRVSPSKLKKVDSPLHLIDSKPVNPHHTLSGNRATLTWSLQNTEAEFQYKVHLNGDVLDAQSATKYTTGSLSPGKYTWFVEARLVFEGQVVESFQSKEDHFTIGGGGGSPSEAVDLGLSVKWASGNIGASSPSDPGYYFAWGETRESADYSISSYDWYKDNGFIKYNGTDNLSILLSEDDAAHTTLGGNWRTPTMGEWEELRNNCDWREVKDGEDLLGYNIFSRTNDNYIFLPVTGYKDGTELRDENRPRYWSSSITNGDDLGRARNLNEGCYNTRYYYYGDERRFGMPVRAVYDDSSEEEPLTSGDYVDMGLSVQWASANMGALNIEDIGDYYAWGETTAKESFTWDNYILSQHPDGDQMTKYNRNDNLSVLLSEDDAVHTAFRGNHRMPTKGEWDELWNNCTAKQITINGRRGYLLTSNVNQNKIFLPFSGYIDGQQLRDGMRPRYWSSSHTNGDDLGRARNINEYCYNTRYYYYGDERRFGMPIRAVYDYKAEEISLTTGSFVDMGLSVEWASANIGASRPELIGYYFAWGEVRSKSEFTWSTYKWHSDGSMTKYNGSDGLRILDLEDDLVYSRYGSNYRMPTKGEWDELWENCTSEQKVINGRRGLLLTSKKNQNKIFLPFSGYMDAKQLRDGMRPRLWSSTITNGDDLSKSRNLNEACYNTRYYYYGDERRLGMPVRAVKAKYEEIVTPGEMVDLGLSVNWASTNMGAELPEDTGDYFAWGETTAKITYTWDNYNLSEHPKGNGMLKYNNADGLRLLDWNDDVVHAVKGGSWRMPSMAEWEELKNSCDWIETTLNGVRGFRIVSRTNGNSIFLASAGYMDNGQLRDGMRPRYWSSTHTNGDDLGRARNLNEYCYNTRYYYYGDERRLGMPVRAVFDYSAERVSLTAGTFVDMGLSVDWASANMGATSPEMTGNYYAWGELRPKDSYSWNTYKWWTEDGLTKYNGNDGLKILHRGDDVVYAKYKSNHRIPTKAEWEELWNNCDISHIIINGRQGYLLKSRINQNTIFLPISGYIDDKQLRDGMRPRYWSSSHTNGDDLGRTRNLNEACYNTRYYYYGDERRLGMPVRGILAKYETDVTQGEMIDLGLSVKWARTNMGASLPEDTGIYYAWGETTGKDRYTWDNYVYSEHPEGSGMTKYDGNDGRRVLDWNDDVVHSVKGGSWRMPGKAEWEELQNECDWIETTMNGIRGFRIVSRKNGNSIFLPKAGFMDGTQLRDGMRSRYWSATHTNGDDLGKVRNLNENCYNTRYYYYGDERRLGMPIRGIYDDSVDRILNTGEIVDMGLSVNWARSNVGTDNPEDMGLYFGWGEIHSHSIFSWENYALNQGGQSPVMMKYNSEDKIRILEEEDDAAYHYSNGRFRMPSIDEWNELMSNTTREVKIKNGHIGYLLKSKINGNTLFLPFTGYKDQSQLRDAMRPRYWSLNQTNGDDLGRARNLNEYCYNTRYYYYGDERRLGMPVRGVTSEGGNGTQPVEITEVTLDKSTMTLSVGCGGSLICMVSPASADDTVTWHSSNPSVARVSSGGRVFATSAGVATITATTVDGNHSASCQVTVNDNAPFEPIDLGLSVQWATFNVGAGSPAEFGEYFAWGEIEPKDSYGWDNYKWGNGFSGSLTKYTGSSIDMLSAEDDIAQVYWGNGWRMPSMSEQQELIDECDWLWTREGLVYGYRVTSRKPGYTDRSIFIPASGYMEGGELKGVMTSGRYWSRTLFFTQTAQAYLLNFSESGKNWNVANRSQGLTVRPVIEPAVVTGVSLDQTEITISVGSSTQLAATVTPINAVNREVTWKSSSPSVATVSDDGTVTAVAKGNAIITVTTASGGYTATCSVKVNPYESSDYSTDGIVHTIQTASQGEGINIVLMGDGFSDRLIADGTYDRMMRKAADAFFIEEPFSSFRSYFNVYYVVAVSRNEEIFPKNESHDSETAIGTWYTRNSTEVGGDHDKAQAYAKNVIAPSQIPESVIIVMMNLDYFAGTCYYRDDGPSICDHGLGTAIAYFPTYHDTEDFNGLVSHEAGGHGFGKLADEYYADELKNTTIPQDEKESRMAFMAHGFSRNVDFSSDRETVKWSQFISDERYGDEGLGTFEGGFRYGKGVWHPTRQSIMNENAGGFNAPSRYAIWYRIHKQALGINWEGTYEDFVSYDKVNRTPQAAARRKRQVERAARQPLPRLAPPVLMSKD